MTLKNEYMIIPADCIATLSKMKENSIDSMVTDPPAGISFMGKSWDHGAAFKINMLRIFSECLRVLKPGAHALVWAIPRTSHWTATALEDAGFEIRDVITHLFGSGFPKSLDISKAIDKAAGAEREIVGKVTHHDIRNGSLVGKAGLVETNITAPRTDAAKLWQGFGTALKPASEHWILCRKPLSEKTVAANVLLHGTGGINIDGCRIGYASEADKASSVPGGKVSYASGSFAQQAGLEKDLQPKREPPQGRFPANLVLSHDEECQIWDIKPNHPLLDGCDSKSEWLCTPTCAVKMLDEQSGTLVTNSGKWKGAAGGGNNIYSPFGKLQGEYAPSNSGGASRFFYCAKASKSERNLGCESNGHPTVKPIRLMRYLCRLVTPQNGVILDPFMGSGSTGVAALTEHFHFIGIERDPDYFKIANTRLRFCYFGKEDE